MQKGGLGFAASDMQVEAHLLPYQKAPVIRMLDGKPDLAFFQFSLVPSWSKEPRVRFATHNARLESVSEKPTWRIPFLHQHVLVPVSGFVEPIYSGEFAGNMVEFFPKQGTLLFAAGIYDEWVDKKTGEVLESFSLLTTEPPPFVDEIGHDRCPIFLPPSAFQEWLGSKEKDAEKLKQFLLSHQQQVDLSVRVSRPLKKGWEKRA